jgi:hypothetical protein
VGEQLITIPLPVHNHGKTRAHTHTHKHQMSMPGVGFERTVPASEQAKTVHALDRDRRNLCFAGLITYADGDVDLNFDCYEDCQMKLNY